MASIETRTSWLVAFTMLAVMSFAFGAPFVTVVALKNIVPAALVLVALRFLAYPNPIVSQAVLTTAIPMMPILIMLAMQYQVAQAEAAAEVFLSSVSSVITMGAFIALTSQLT